MKNSTILKINSIKSITNPAQIESKPKSPSKLSRASPVGLDSQGSIPINESDQEESSSNSDTTLMRYTNGRKSNGSKSSKNSPVKKEGKNFTESKFF